MSDELYREMKQTVICDNCCNQSPHGLSRELRDLGWRWFKLGRIEYALCERCRKQNEALEASGDE